MHKIFFNFHFHFQVSGTDALLCLNVCQYFAVQYSQLQLMRLQHQ